MRHHVSFDCTTLFSFQRRRWVEGISETTAAVLPDPRSALAAATRHGDPNRIGRAPADLRGSIPATGYGAGLASAHTRRPARGNTMTDQPTTPAGNWLKFNVHGRLGIRVLEGPAATQLATMLSCFATDADVPGDIVVSPIGSPSRMLPISSTTSDTPPTAWSSWTRKCRSSATTVATGSTARASF